MLLMLMLMGVWIVFATRVFTSVHIVVACNSALLSAVLSALRR